MNLKRFTLSSLLPGLGILLFLYSSGIASAQKVTYPDSWGNQGFTLMQQSPAGVSLNFSVNEFTFQDRIIQPAIHQPVYCHPTRGHCQS
jgi:hypothetical protein